VVSTQSTTRYRISIFFFFFFFRAGLLLFYCNKVTLDETVLYLQRGRAPSGKSPPSRSASQNNLEDAVVCDFLGVDHPYPDPRARNFLGLQPGLCAD
jgi:hypothetical protein